MKLPGKEAETTDAVKRQAGNKFGRFTWCHPTTTEDQAFLAGVDGDGVPLGIKPVLQGNFSCLVHHYHSPGKISTICGRQGLQSLIRNTTGPMMASEACFAPIPVNTVV